MRPAEAPHEIVHTGRRGKKLGHLFKRSAAPKTALEIVKQTRSADRATAGEMISLGLDGFVELHGDRYFGDDAAVVGGIGWKDGRPVTVIAIERGTTTKERMRRNFGMAHPEGYRKARRLMHRAEMFGRPVLCWSILRARFAASVPRSAAGRGDCPESHGDERP